MVLRSQDAISQSQSTQSLERSNSGPFNVSNQLNIRNQTQTEDSSLPHWDSSRNQSSRTTTVANADGQPLSEMRLAQPRPTSYQNISTPIRRNSTNGYQARLVHDPPHIPFSDGLGRVVPEGLSTHRNVRAGTNFDPGAIFETTKAIAKSTGFNFMDCVPQRPLMPVSSLQNYHSPGALKSIKLLVAREAYEQKVCGCFGLNLYGAEQELYNLTKTFKPSFNPLHRGISPSFSVDAGNIRSCGKYTVSSPHEGEFNEVGQAGLKKPFVSNSAAKNPYKYIKVS